MTDFTLICGDAAATLAALPEGCVACVVTSPPYNAGKAYEQAVTLDAYRAFARAWVAEVPRLLTPDGSFWLNVGYTKTGPNSALPLTYLYHPLVDLPLVQEVVWHYEGGMAYKRRFAHRTERWMWFAPDPLGAFFDLDAVRDPTLNRTRDRRNHALGKNPTDYWYFDRVVSGTGRVAEKTAHPCQFPEAMIERVLRACSRPGDVVLDPFCGSGTVGVVARQLGRHFVGIDLDPGYLDLARERLQRGG